MFLVPWIQRMVAGLTLVFCAACTGSLPGAYEARPIKGATVHRDRFGMAHIRGHTAFSAGFGVGVAQVDDHGLDLQMHWALISPQIETWVTQETLDQGIPLSGQVPATLQFDSRGFPVPDALRRAGAPTLQEIRRTLAYLNFYEGAEETQARLMSAPAGSLDASLRDYLSGFVAGAQDRLRQKRRSFETSTNPRIQAMVARGLHLRTPSLLDPIRSGATQALTTSVGLVTIWANFIQLVPTATALTQMKMAPPQYTASNQFGISGVSTQSGRPIIMVDPHLPMFNVWGNTSLSTVVQLPQITFDAAIPVGQPVPFVGHSLTPKDKSGFALTGTANAHTPTTCWYSAVPPDLSTYRAATTPEGGQAFTLRTIEGLVVREAGEYGRLIGQRRVQLGDQQLEIGFLYRAAKDHKYSMIETLWAAFHSRTVSEFYAALNRHSHPFWNMVVGFSTPQRLSTVLYINNQISARRDPNPDGNSATLDDWNQFMDAMNPRTRWLGDYHQAHELPQVIAEDASRKFLHCHNCSSELVTGVNPQQPYMVGGFLGYSNPRHDVGQLVYSQITSGGTPLRLEDGVMLANHKRDLQLEEIVSKLSATLAAHAYLLDLEQISDAEREIERWRDGPVEGTLDNTRVARVLMWIRRMKAASGWSQSRDLERLVTGIRYPVAETVFDPSSPIEAQDALIPLLKLVEVAREFAAEHGSDFRTWGEIQRFRPQVFGVQLGDYPLAGTPEALLSVGGPLTGEPGTKVFSVNGGQNYVQVIEVGSRSVLKKSVSGTSNAALSYAGAMSERFAREEFLPTGVLESELMGSRIISSEVFATER